MPCCPGAAPPDPSAPPFPGYAWKNKVPDDEDDGGGDSNDDGDDDGDGDGDGDDDDDDDDIFTVFTMTTFRFSS